MKIRGLLFLPLLVVGSMIVGCEQKVNKVDFVHNGSCRLELDYHNKDFYTQGVCEVTLAAKGTIDGDTAHFHPKTGSGQNVRLKARFYGVDTPESTGQIEPYGKDASDFTKQKLLDAAENGTIVISSPRLDYGEPTADSTGSRYVLMVWINETKKNADLDELYSLNLWLVQEGLSYAKALDKMPQYKKVFDKAESQARSLKLKLFSGKPDPRYNYGDYEDVPFYDIAKEIQDGLKGETPSYTYDGANVHLRGTVAGYSNNSLYLQNFFTFDEGAAKEEGEYVGLNIFCGMSEIPGRFQELGAYIEIYGKAVNSQFGFQITSCYFPRTKSAEEDTSCKVLLKAEQNQAEVTEIIDENTGEHGHKLKQFTMTREELSDLVNQKDYSLLLQPITITNTVTPVENAVIGGVKRYSYMNDDFEASLILENQTFGVYVPYIYYYNPKDSTGTVIKDIEWFYGKEFNITNAILSFHIDNKDNLTLQFYPADTTQFLWTEMTPPNPGE